MHNVQVFLQHVRIARSACHVPVLCPDEWRYDRVVFNLW